MCVRTYINNTHTYNINNVHTYTQSQTNTNTRHNLLFPRRPHSHIHKFTYKRHNSFLLRRAHSHKMMSKSLGVAQDLIKHTSHINEFTHLHTHTRFVLTTQSTLSQVMSKVLGVTQDLIIIKSKKARSSRRRSLLAAGTDVTFQVCLCVTYACMRMYACVCICMYAYVCMCVYGVCGSCRHR